MRAVERVLLLNPPDAAVLEGEGTLGDAYFEPPLGILYVYDFLKKRGDLEVRFVDLNVALAGVPGATLAGAVEGVMADFRPDLVAVAAVYYSGLAVFREVAAAVRGADPNAVIVFGGHYPTHSTDRCLADASVDYAVLSEGELGLSDLVDALNGGRELDEVEGIAFRRDGAVVRHERTTFWSGYGDVGRLPWEDVAFGDYFRGGANFLRRVRDASTLRLGVLTASRGCPNACGFCTSPSFWRRRWRKRRVENVLDEIRHLQDRYGVNTVMFNDENLGADRGWFLELLDGLATLDVSWVSTGGLNVAAINDETVIRKMYDSGVVLFNLAIESGSNATLDRIGKRLTTEDTENVIRLIRECGEGYAIGFFIVGFPFEDLAGVRGTLDFAASLDLDWRSFYCFQPFPGCSLRDYAIDHGLLDPLDCGDADGFFAPKMTYPNYTSDDLSHVNYLANLEWNFVNNRNVRRNTPAALEQAERDFRYVLDFVPNHVFAELGLAEVSRARGDGAGRRRHLERAAACVAQSDFDWPRYLEAFGVDIGGAMDKEGHPVWGGTAT